MTWGNMPKYLQWFSLVDWVSGDFCFILYPYFSCSSEFLQWVYNLYSWICYFNQKFFLFNKIENVAPNDDCHSLVLWISDMNLIRSHLETMLGLDFTDCYFQIGEACRIFNQGRCHWIFGCMVSARRSISKTYQNFKVE